MIPALSELMEGLEGKRILLVDHDSQVRDAIALMLQALKAVVVHAEDALRALVLYERHPFDVVVTDYNLPDMKGDELAEAIKSSAPNQRVILLTGYIEQVFESCRVPMLVDVVLSKPCSLEQLALALRYPVPAPAVQLPATQ
jgi:CheY-like chemotaxis protein